MKSKILLLLPLASLFVSCAQDSLTGDVYSRDEARMGQSVEYGRVTNVRSVKIEGGNTMGTLIGGAAGGVLGSNIGGGRAANQAGAIGGALLGGILGSNIQKSTSSRQGAEISVRLDGGRTVAVVQEVNARTEVFNVGDRVRVISSGGNMRVAY